jgi:hypothetical protein
MAREVTCPGCSQSFEAPEFSEEPWLECPHCQERTVNLGALKSAESVWRGVVGGILTVLAGLAGIVTVLWLIFMVGTIYALLIDPGGPWGRQTWIEFFVGLFMILPCGLLFLSAVLFVRAGARPAGRAARTVGALAALVGSFLAVAVLVFIITLLSRH